MNIGTIMPSSTAALNPRAVAAARARDRIRNMLVRRYGKATPYIVPNYRNVFPSGLWNKSLLRGLGDEFNDGGINQPMADSTFAPSSSDTGGFFSADSLTKLMTGAADAYSRLTRAQNPAPRPLTPGIRPTLSMGAFSTPLVIGGVAVGGFLLYKLLKR